MLKPMNQMTWKQLSQIPAKDIWLVLPISSLEQHGTHLPIGTDDLILQRMLQEITCNPALQEDFYLLPSIHYGSSVEHLAFPGTVTLTGTTIISMVEDILKSLQAHGYTKLVLLNSHGGNTHLLHGMAQSWHHFFGIQTYNIDFFVSNFFDGAASLIETPLRYDIHGGELETSFFEYAYPELVDYDALAQQEDVLPDLPRHSSAWLTDDICKSGVLGGASKSTPEKGRLLLDYMRNKIIDTLHEIRAQS